jgi:dTDP-4-amino-4,6-dideoxygalactose transaminase
MNHYRKKTYYRKRNFNSNNRNNRRYKDTYHQPARDEDANIPYSQHTLTKGDVEAVVEALLSGTITQGKELDRFEGLLAKLTHCHYALAVSSGTAAIHTALAAIGLKEGDEVVTSTLNFCAVANMVKFMGAVPVLVDCDPETLTLSVEGTRNALTPKTKAVFTNNFAGHPSDLHALREICDEHELFLLEDACHGLGGRYKGHYVGNQADLTCFSFHPSKAITSGEGGAVTTNDVDKFAFMKLFRHHGIQKDADYFQSESFNPMFHQEVQFPGMNYRMNEMQAAMGRNQLTRLDRHIERRRAIAQVYKTNLSELSSLILPNGADWADHAFHLFPIQLTGGMFGKRDQLFADFKANGIDVQVHYVPLHHMPFYQEENKDKAFPNAETYFQNCISLPVYPDLSIKDIDRIIDILKKNIEANQDAVEGAEVQEAQTEDVVTEAFMQSVQEDDDSAESRMESIESSAGEQDIVEPAPVKKASPYRRRGRRKISTVKKTEAPQIVESPVEALAPVQAEADVKPEETAPAPKKSTGRRKLTTRKTVTRKPRKDTAPTEKSGNMPDKVVPETVNPAPDTPPDSEGAGKTEKTAKPKTTTRKTTARKTTATRKRTTKSKAVADRGNESSDNSETQATPEKKPARKVRRTSKPKAAQGEEAATEKAPAKKKVGRKPKAKTATTTKKTKTTVKKSHKDET